MARIKLPSGIPSEQIDNVFRYIIKLSPKRELAVRLRFDGLTYREVADQINAMKVDTAKVNVMWVQRCCQRAKFKLYKASKDQYNFVKDQYEEPNSLRILVQVASSDPLILLVDKLFGALQEGEHKIPGPIFNRPSTFLSGSYPCPFCRKGGWTYRTINMGGHKNFRIYVCSECGREFTASERRKLKHHLPKAPSAKNI